MKSALVLALALIGSTSFASLVSGQYHCATADNSYQITYKITNVTTGGVEIPYVDVTQVYAADGTTPARTFNLKGVANLATDENGQQRLMIGNLNVSLTNGRPSCAQ
ncbi:MAG: hypothetical protein ACXWQQ_14155 [Pseudobdellovibrio sp.]